MSDESEEPHAGAEDNPWYLLATLYGVPGPWSPQQIPDDRSGTKGRSLERMALFVQFCTDDSGRATSSRGFRSAATPQIAATMAAATMSAEPIK
jgi:hypothetical protein